ncbi:replication protein A 70 kDa DNA-binding subunit [Erythrolamprus reginae]|uniref:replication protein A 70 kDa DNA-binding subunit n=1 Tax=Erythrolamprus reginae TaxID=121349 RepID=UPI00396C4350
MAAARLSEGAIAAMLVQAEAVERPVLQLITIRPITTGNGPPRYRLLMSDGVHTLSSFMLATQLNSLVDDESLTANAVCQINRFIVNTLKDGRRVVVLMEMEVLRPGHAVPAKIGNPVPYTEGKRRLTKRVGNLCTGFTVCVNTAVTKERTHPSLAQEFSRQALCGLGGSGRGLVFPAMAEG